VKTASVSEQESAEKQADLALKTATVDAARAAVHRLEELKSFARVTAPFEGSITARRTDTGDLIRADAAKELFRLAQTKTLRVFVRVPQGAARAVKPGQLAELTIPELPGKIFAAKIVRASGAMSADSRTLLTELEVDNTKNELLAGSYAQVRLTDSRPEAAMTLPSNTLLFRSTGPHVALVNAQDKVELRPVTLGRDFGATIEILSGVAVSDRIVLNPPDSLVGGMTVRVAKTENTDK
jgi:membrane fusion protein (multidrug efflux system)